MVELRLTVDDGNVPVLVVLREGDGRALSRCHDAHCPAAVPAVQVNGGAELRAVDRQRVREAEGRHHGCGRGSKTYTTTG